VPRPRRGDFSPPCKYGGEKSVRKTSAARISRKRGQITIFIIIGILVLVAFSIALYVGTKMKQRIEVKQTQQTTEKFGIQPIQDYITTCLSLATTEALSLIGRQGGVIYQN